MNTNSLLVKEKIISISELRKNPNRALNASIVSILKNGKEIGIYLSKEALEDLLEDSLPYKSEFKTILKETQKKEKKSKLTKLSNLKIKLLSFSLRRLQNSL